ncbi:hypothetical protein CONPUDRAFT_56708 [Coniophora puteana RWD-64-598 SS2]|uniref:Uncharacterized protein n=1 Tax=Coniophora puteana (strain RWD-64-598) TaxID=741705 RepID=A0A5M3MN44_CONPW|nr:uncharacterized protein CONPUDRAFT_56708 [Coniophora puteana RWD-64-598 SS2]EIW80602.1 hypothetical protein CONPUDRAFT_56708 [Coniophora puteana RWD-64-598 SS2]
MAPFTNPTQGILAAYYYGRSRAKTEADSEFLESLITHPLFEKTEAKGFRLHTQNKRLDEFLKTKDGNIFRQEHGWQVSSFEIPLPFEGRRTIGGEQNVPKLRVEGVYHRRIASIVQGALEDPISNTYNTTPFEQHWRTADGQDMRVYSEAYSSDAVLDAYHEVNAAPRPSGDNYERIVVPLMLWSDATLLANFGSASLWPIYLFLGNQSKHVRNKPSAHACHHVAYIPSLPDGWQNTYTGIFGKPPTKDVHTHLKRELVHAVWRLLLQDDDFKRAYDQGLLTKCSDDIIRRAFIRFFTYGADYPEKVLLCTIKFLAKFPCPRCLTPKFRVGEMGMRLDMLRRAKARIDSAERQDLVQRARVRIFKNGRSVNSKRVMSLLDYHSYVPVKNAFSEFLLERGVNFFALFPVDVLHEFELGVWKAIFVHLIRMALSIGGSAVQDINDR